MPASRIYFIISCARSGSTSLAKILDTATNGSCLVEPLPNFNRESRDFMEGRLRNPREVLVRDVLPRISMVLDEGRIYGEKNVTFGPFIPAFHEMLRCKFVFLTRDGRDVATSLMNWHNEAFGTIYRECNDAGSLSKLALRVKAALPLEEDSSDYARPRPGPDDPFYREWANLSRFEMVTWYWSHSNCLYAENLRGIPSEQWRQIDYTNVTADEIEELFDFLGLKGFNRAVTEKLLQQRINSLWERFHMRTRFPSWRDWSPEMFRQFKRIAAPTMQSLGYDAEGQRFEESRKKAV